MDINERIREIGSTIAEARGKRGLSQYHMRVAMGSAGRPANGKRLEVIENGEGDYSVRTLLTVLDTVGLDLQIVEGEKSANNPPTSEGANAENSRQ